MSRPLIRRSGSAPTASSTRTSRAAIERRRRLVEQVRRELHRRRQPARRPSAARTSARSNSRSNLAVTVSTGTRRAGQPGQRQRRRAQWHSAPQHDLEQRVAGQRPGRDEDLHQPLERHVLMRQRRQPDLPDPAQQLTRTPGPPTRSVRSTSVLTKNPTRSSSASSVRPATGVPSGISVPAAQPGQQHRQRRLHHHEQRHALLPGQPRQPRVHRRREPPAGTACPR